jgi:hypothetical protein
MDLNGMLEGFRWVSMGFKGWSGPFKNAGNLPNMSKLWVFVCLYHDFHMVLMRRGIEYVRFSCWRHLRDEQTTEFIRSCWIIANDLLGINVYTLWWTNSLLWKDPPFFMGKSTISMAIFNSKLLVHQRVNIPHRHMSPWSPHSWHN